MTIEPELTTLIDYLRFAASRFNEAALYFGHGTENAWDEASALVLHALHLPHDITPAVLTAHLTATEKEKLTNLIEQRITKRIPLPYLTHEAWFNGLSFYVDERVLIPRSPIAELIEQHFEPWAIGHEIRYILDMCTGSGCIAVSCAKAFPEAEIDASDLSPHAIAVAKINLVRHQVADQVTLYQGDLFNNLPKKKYDIIVSNPPYVSQEEMLALPQEYLHEPSLGLAADQEGIEVALRILKKATHYLSPQGLLIIEVGNSEEALIEMYPDFPFTWLEFQKGGGGVFLMTAEQLKTIQNKF